MQCQHTPCLPTPEDVKKLIAAGYGDRLSLTDWGAGVIMGVTDEVIPIIAPTYDNTKRACTFFNNGLCDLHNKDLKPTEGRLSHHTLSATNFDPKKSISWAVVKEWWGMNEDDVVALYESSKTVSHVH